MNTTTRLRCEPRDSTRERGAVGLAALITTLLLLLAPGLSAQSPCGATVTVTLGDTLAEIAARCGTTVSALTRANEQIEDPNLIRIGWALTIPTRVEQASPEPEPEPEAERFPSAAVSVTSQRVVPGERVLLSVRGFPPNHSVNIGAGPWRSEFSIIDRARTDAGGRLNTTVRMPDWADPGDRFVFVVEAPDHGLTTVTEPIVVVSAAERPDAPRPDLDPGEWVRISGTLSGEGVECRGLRSEGGILFTLTRVPEAFEEGDRVQVVGTVAEFSFCQQDTTIQVEDIAAVDENFGNPRPVIRVEGRLTDDGIECQALRSDTGRLYTLVGGLEGFGTSEQVYVEGTEVDASVCQQGTTLEVRVIRKRDPGSER